MATALFAYIDFLITLLSFLQAVNESLTFTMDVVEGKKKAAKNENEFIYHEVVPDKDLLPSVKGASLVKGIPFNENDSEVSGPDIFARLVPMKSHEASSLYRWVIFHTPHVTNIQLMHLKKLIFLGHE